MPQQMSFYVKRTISLSLSSSGIHCTPVHQLCTVVTGSLGPIRLNNAKRAKQANTTQPYVPLISQHSRSQLNNTLSIQYCVQQQASSQCAGSCGDNPQIIHFYHTYKTEKKNGKRKTEYYFRKPVSHNHIGVALKSHGTTHKEKQSVLSFYRNI